MRKFFIWARGKVYTWRNRVYFTDSEVRYLIDMVDAWIEAYPDVGVYADDDEVDQLHRDMSTAMEVRDKLWRQLNG